MIFNPWKHLRNAACVVFFFVMQYPSPPLLYFGIVLLMTGIVGGLDLSERRIELLEKEKHNEKRDSDKTAH